MVSTQCQDLAGKAKLRRSCVPEKERPEQGQEESQGNKNGVARFPLNPVVSAMSRQLGGHLALGVECP